MDGGTDVASVTLVVVPMIYSMSEIICRQYHAKLEKILWEVKAIMQGYVITDSSNRMCTCW